MATASALLASIAEILTLGWKVFLLWRESKAKKWVDQGRSLAQIISEAKTDEERAELARKLFNHRAS